MDQDWWKRTQIILAIVLVIALIRVGFIFYDRTHETDAPKSEPVSSSRYKVSLDDYVTPHKVFPYDLKSARELVGKTAWIRVGNELAYYPYKPATHGMDLSRRSGLLGPLEKVEIKDVIGQRVQGESQVMAIFTRPDSAAQYAVSIGTVDHGYYTFIINDIFFLEDPHGLYNHWPPDVWRAIDHHEAKVGMNELQVSFALGTNMRATPGDYGNRTVEYTNAGKVTSVVFSDNQALTVKDAGQQ
jgi:hypothetical protein